VSRYLALAEQNSSSEDQKGFRISSKINLIFIILILLSAVPIAIGFIGIFDQFTQPTILYTTMSGNYDAEYTISLEANSIYYITITPSEAGMIRDFIGELSFVKDNVEVYHDTIQKPSDSIGRGITFTFNPFIPDMEGFYIINCTITYTDNNYPFYIKMQRATEIAQITGYSGEEILGVGMIIFLAVMVLLIIVSLIARVQHVIRRRKLADQPEQPQSNFIWESKDGNEGS